MSLMLAYDFWCKSSLVSELQPIHHCLFHSLNANLQSIPSHDNLNLRKLSFVREDVENNQIWNQYFTGSWSQVWTIHIPSVQVPQDMLKHWHMHPTMKVWSSNKNRVNLSALRLWCVLNLAFRRCAFFFRWSLLVLSASGFRFEGAYDDTWVVVQALLFTRSQNHIRWSTLYCNLSTFHFLAKFRLMNVMLITYYRCPAIPEFIWSGATFVIPHTTCWQILSHVTNVTTTALHPVLSLHIKLDWPVSLRVQSKTFNVEIPATRFLYFSQRISFKLTMQSMN